MSKQAHGDKLQPFSARGYRVGIVVAQFNHAITEQLLNSALAEAKAYAITQKNISVYRVAGSVEIPVVLHALAKTKKYDALVALGAVIRGETDHYDYVIKILTEGITEVMLEDEGIPVGFGVLTCENKKQAQARVALGAGALAAAVHSARLIRLIQHGK